MRKIIWGPDFYFKIITKSHSKSSKTHSVWASWTLGLHQMVFLSVTLKCAFPTTVIIIKASNHSAICTVSLNTDLPEQFKTKARRLPLISSILHGHWCLHGRGCGQMQQEHHLGTFWVRTLIWCCSFSKTLHVGWKKRGKACLVLWKKRISQEHRAQAQQWHSSMAQEEQHSSGWAG